MRSEYLLYSENPRDEANGRLLAVESSSTLTSAPGYTSLPDNGLISTEPNKPCFFTILPLAIGRPLVSMITTRSPTRPCFNSATHLFVLPSQDLIVEPSALLEITNRARTEIVLVIAESLLIIIGSPNG